MDQSATLTHLKIFVSFDCNLRCAHCVHGRFSSEKNPPYDRAHLQRLRVFLEGLCEHNSHLNIYLSGGEPLLSPRFFQVARLIKAVGLTYKTITNGLLLSKRSQQLLEAPPHSLWVTFNGVDEQHNLTVGLASGYEKLRKAVQSTLPLLRSAGIKCGAVLMINPLTYDKISEDIVLIGAMGFDEVVVQHLSFLPDSFLERHQAVFQEKFGSPSGFCFGEGADGREIDPSALYRELKAVRQKVYPFQYTIFPPLYQENDLQDYYSEFPQKWKDRSCRRAIHEWWILPDGSITVCFAHRIGHIGQSFDDLTRSKPLLEWQRQVSGLSEPFPGCIRCHRLYVSQN